MQKGLLAFSVYTYNQTQGRGQYGNSWTTLENKNLAFSLALAKDKCPLDENLLNYHTAETIRCFLAKLTQLDVFVKWPNDLILQKKKVSGMLIEKKRFGSEWYYIIGVGINVNQQDFTSLPSAGSLWTQSGVHYELDNLAQSLNAFLFAHLLNFPPESQILESYNAHLFKRGELGVYEIEGLRQNGIIQYADREGRLHVDLEHRGLEAFYHKTIKMLY